MIKYYLNKNFIPKGFIEKKYNEQNNRNKRSMFLLGIVTIAFLPIAIRFISNNIFYKEDYKICEEKNKNFNCNDESFFWWLDIIKDDTVGTFNNVDATIYVDNMDKFYEILKNKNIEVKSVERCDDTKIQVQISKYTKE
ncbi:MAG: hypothetical protein E7213_03000 [Clostridium sp.]|nr:hypothetical protein [Clostridium sp.]